MSDSPDVLFVHSDTAHPEIARDYPHDEALGDVEAWFLSQRNMEERFAHLFRKAIDEVVDGQRTGRFNIHDKDLVSKTERTYLGTKVEILCRAEFDLPRGAHMDYLVSGHEVDAKFSLDGRTKQAIPSEAVDQICLIMHARDDTSRFCVGLVRTTADILSPGKGNKDGKKGILAKGRSQIRWLVRDAVMIENQLLRLPDALRQSIFDIPTPKGQGNGGQQRINQLLRVFQGRIINRETTLAVAAQKDSLKRPRDARKQLRSEGIIVLGHQDDHPRIARGLGLPIPHKGEFVSVRVIPHSAEDNRASTMIDGARYTVALPEDPVVQAPGSY